MVSAKDIEEALCSMGNDEQRIVLQRFFKTGKGQYAAGDKFIGLRVPQTRMVVRSARRQVPFPEIHKLLVSPLHEVRLAGFLLLVDEMNSAIPKRDEPLTTNAARRKEIVDFYLAHARNANNWDLVDNSCPTIVGKFLLFPTSDGSLPSRGILDSLAASDNLWEQRIAIVSNWQLIRAGQHDDILRIADKLINHRHDLIHKAIGWMLREVGKSDIEVLRRFLDSRAPYLPRTTLRYAIERMDESERQYWLKLKV